MNIGRSLSNCHGSPEPHRRGKSKKTQKSAESHMAALNPSSIDLAVGITIIIILCVAFFGSWFYLALRDRKQTQNVNDTLANKRKSVFVYFEGPDILRDSMNPLKLTPRLQPLPTPEIRKLPGPQPMKSPPKPYPLYASPQNSPRLPFLPQQRMQQPMKPPMQQSQQPQRARIPSPPHRPAIPTRKHPPSPQLKPEVFREPYVPSPRLEQYPMMAYDPTSPSLAKSPLRDSMSEYSLSY